jgi:GntR family transcriptional regulator
MQLFVAPSADVPIYRQIMRQIIEGIATGRLVPGEKLPSHRELAEQIVVAPLTVKKAYDELDALGYIATQRGRGTFVRDELPEPDRKEQAALLRRGARDLLAQAYLAGLGLSDVHRLVTAAGRELAERAAATPRRRMG